MNERNISDVTQRTIHKLAANPKRLFLIDGLGGLITAFFLIFILGKFERLFGMPKVTLHILAFAAIVYAIYSLSCHFFIKHKWKPYLKAIAIANLLYCLVIIVLLFYYYNRLTAACIIYFILEVAVIGALVSVELKAVSYPGSFPGQSSPL